MGSMYCNKRGCGWREYNESQFDLLTSNCPRCAEKKQQEEAAKKAKEREREARAASLVERTEKDKKSPTEPKKTSVSRSTQKKKVSRTVARDPEAEAKLMEERVKGAIALTQAGVKGTVALGKAGVKTGVKLGGCYIKFLLISGALVLISLPFRFMSSCFKSIGAADSLPSKFKGAYILDDKEMELTSSSIMVRYKQFPSAKEKTSKTGTLKYIHTENEDSVTFEMTPELDLNCSEMRIEKTSSGIIVLGTGYLNDCKDFAGKWNLK